MRVAALYDIHGNLPALEAVLAEVDRLRPDVLLVGGDVALGPMPRDTLDLLEARGDGVRWLRGNCDRELSVPPAETGSGAWGERTAWTAARCTAAQLTRLAGLPLTQRLDVDGLGEVLFCHGSPRRDDEILTRVTPETRLARVLDNVAAAVIVSGHTHLQSDRLAAGRRLVNPGSVGMAYAREPGAYWALLGPDVQLMRTAYDVEAAIAGTRAAGFPDAEEFISKYLVQRPAPEEASRFFEELAGTREAHA